MNYVKFFSTHSFIYILSEKKGKNLNLFTYYVKANIIKRIKKNYYANVWLSRSGKESKIHNIAFYPPGAISRLEYKLFRN